MEQRVEIVISAKDQASSTLSGISSSIGSLGKAFTVGAIAATAALTAIGAGITKLAINAGEFESLCFAGKDVKTVCDDQARPTSPIRTSSSGCLAEIGRRA